MAGSDSQLAAQILGPMSIASGTCSRHGDWSREVPKFLVGQTGCDLCTHDARVAREAQERAERAAAAADRRVLALSERGVGARHLDKTFDTFVAENDEQRRALVACRSAAEAVASRAKRVPSLILCGGPGTGKTHLTCAMVQHCHDAGRNAMKANVMEIIRNIKASWRKGSDHDEEDVIAWYANRDLLVIDEIGVQFGTDTERMYVFEIINRRYEDCQPTVLISNLDVESLRAEVGERVLDRLREDGGKLLAFTGQSWRKS